MTKAWLGFVRYSDDIRKPPIGWKIIKFFLGSDIVHAFIIYLENDELWVYQTSESVFQRIPFLDRVKDTKCDFFLLPGDAGKGRAYSLNQLGKFYDYTGVVPLGIAGLAEQLLNLLLKPFGFKRKLKVIVYDSDFNMKSMYYCTEPCIEAMLAMGIKLPQWWDNAEIGPPLLYQYAMENFLQDSFGSELKK